MPTRLLCTMIRKRKTNRKINFDLSKPFLAKITEDIDINDIEKGVPVYIPLLMCNIDYGSPKSQMIRIISTNIFKNDKECKPKLSSVIKQQNYITVNKENNTTLSKLVIKKDNKEIISMGTKVEVQFNHGKLSVGTFNTDKNF